MVFDFVYVINKLNELVKAMLVNQESTNERGSTNRALTLYLRYVVVKLIAEANIPLDVKTKKGTQLISAHYRRLT